MRIRFPVREEDVDPSGMGQITRFHLRVKKFNSSLDSPNLLFLTLPLFSKIKVLKIDYFFQFKT